MTLRFRDWPWALKLGLLLVTTAIIPLFASTVYSDVMMRRELVANATSMRRLVSAAQPLVKTLDEDQKRDALSLAINTDLGFHYYYTRRYDEAD